MSLPVSIEPTVEYIMEMVPLRYPVLLMDRVLEWVPGERVVAIKAFTAGEPLFGTDTPNAKAPPEALMVEAMLQVGGLTLPRRDGKYVYLLGLDNVEIHRPVQFGEVLVTQAEKLWERGKMFRVAIVSRAQGETALSGEVTFAYLDAPEV